MPRGQKSKLRSREKRRQAQEQTQEPQEAQVSEAAEPSTLSAGEGTSQGSPAAGKPQAPQKASKASTQVKGRAAHSHPRGKKNIEIQDNEKPSTSKASPSTENPHGDLLTRKENLLVQYLLRKFKMNEPIIKADLQRLITRKHRKSFPEILQRASERLELVYGLDLKEVSPRGQSYTLTHKVLKPIKAPMALEKEFTKIGLLMPILGLIFMNGSRSSEKEIWEFLNMLGLYEGKQHHIFGDPQKAMIDYVQEEYLQYVQVPKTNPPRYEYLWGPRAHAETSKLKVLKFLARIHGCTPTAFTSHYEEALREELENTKITDVAENDPPATTEIHTQAKAKAEAQAEAETQAEAEAKAETQAEANISPIVD
ncbi:melanoma-associated antigen B17 [Echinops telfairi]|uniref:Melanoma-associated antigen B17 n=1 Tax=Echinops telfairi TaxID=9371 RepID=A0ABM0IXF8_ECHTE|nr:melanoma-associated antigen B17 [Echinops telfairi]